MGGMKGEEKLKALPTLRLIQSSACQISFFNPERFNASWKSERRHKFSRDFPLLERARHRERGKVPKEDVKSPSDYPKSSGLGNSAVKPQRISRLRPLRRSNSDVPELYRSVRRTSISARRSPVFHKYSRTKKMSLTQA